MKSAAVAERITRLVRVMCAEGWDCVLATSPESVHYLSGALIHIQTLIRRRQCAVLVTREGKTALIVPEIERALATRMSALQVLKTYNVVSQSACSAAIALFGEEPEAPRVIALEKTHLPVIDFELLARSLPTCRFVAADDSLMQLRMPKSASEIETMSFAATAMDEAIASTVAESGVGSAEDEIAAKLGQRVQRLGGGRVRSVTGLVASGGNLHIAHHMADGTRLRDGDVLRIGCRSMIDGYHGIVNRTAVVGECANGTRDHYARVFQAHQQLLRVLQPGAIAQQIYEQMAAMYRTLGLVPTNPHFGYATGLEFQERPRLAPGCSDQLQAGMVILAESVSTDALAGHLYIVDMVLLQDSGTRVLSNVTDTLKPLVLGLDCRVSSQATGSHS